MKKTILANYGSFTFDTQEFNPDLIDELISGAATMVDFMTNAYHFDIIISPTDIPSVQQLRRKTTGIKYDSDKLPLDLLDPVALEGLAAVLKFGAAKYESHNWRNGISYTRLIAAMLRHTFAILRGELTDPESKLPHIDHVGCCWMFLSNLMKTRTDLNDLYPYKKENTATQP